MKKMICLRDDDTNFHTQYQELKDGYGEFWGVLPVTLATVPFAHGSERKIIELENPPQKKFENLRAWELEASASELAEYHKVYPVGENVELVNELKKLITENKIEIAQHGIFHKYNEYGAEMYADNVGLESIRAGMEYLNKVFDTKVKVFIPPSNTIDTKCARYINNLGMSLLTCGSINYRTSKEMFFEVCKYPIDVLKTAKNYVCKEHPPVRKRKGIELIAAITFKKNDTAELFYEKVKNYLDSSNAIVITTHYRLLGELDDEKKTYRNNWQKLLTMLSNFSDVEFVTASQYIEKLNEGKKII